MWNVRLPNKITTYDESNLSKFAPILRILEGCDISIPDLYKTVKTETEDVKNFLDVIDCFYALGKIDYNESERKICYVSNVA